MAGPAAADHADEREVKVAVTEDFVLPALSGLAGVTAVDHGEQRLGAVYWDTDDIQLARAGVGLRRRNGVWTYKGRSRRDGHAVVRQELEVSGPADSIPPELVEQVRRWADPAALHPVAELDTVRHRVDVSDGQGMAEVVHDVVNVVERGRVLARFTEVEVEYGAAAQALADRVVGLVLAAGGEVDATPKYLRALRALGHDPPDVSG